MSTGEHSARLIHATYEPVPATHLQVLIEETQPVKHLKGTWLTLRMDDDDCVMVVIFPRGKQAGGTIDPKTDIEDPYEMAENIFKILQNPESWLTMKKLKNINPEDEVCNAAEYHSDIRGVFIEILQESGIHATQFPSLDGDEDFLKLDVPLHSPVLRHLAEKVKYKMPYKEAVYTQVPGCGAFEGGAPLNNWDKVPVVAYDEFTVEKADMFKEFTFVDQARILEFWLDQWVSLDVMERQGIISAYFPCPKHEDMEELYDKVAHPMLFYKMPDHNSEELIRKYFGEAITFYFRFLAFLVRSIIFLAVIGAVYYALKKVGLVREEDFGIARSAIAAVVSIWAAFVFQRFKITTSRVKQCWGVQDYEEHKQDRPEWDPSQKPNCMPQIVNIITLMYVVAYIGGIWGLLAWSRDQIENEGSLASVASILLTVVIKAGSFVWGKLAPRLVDMENHRTEDSYNTKLIVLLSSVKLFVALWPFITQCFIANLTALTCRDTLDEALADVWKGKPFSSDQRSFMEEHYSFTNALAKVCIVGCYPHWEEDVQAYSPTNCDTNATSSVRTYFIFQVITEMVFIIVGTVLTKLAVRQEMAKVAESDGGKAYSLLQWHAKTWKYELQSWSGSQIEDYLDIAIAYAIVVCFGIISPIMAVIAVVTWSFSYRMRIYRMVFVARRPLPRATAGLGIWGSIFEWINTIAVLCNVGLAASFFYPGRTYPSSEQLAIFMIGEHSILALKVLVDFLIPDDPADVEEIDTYNGFALCHLHAGTSIMPSKDHSTNLGFVNLSLNPHGVSTDDEDSDVGCMK